MNKVKRALVYIAIAAVVVLIGIRVEYHLSIPRSPNFDDPKDSLDTVELLTFCKDVTKEAYETLSPTPLAAASNLRWAMT